MVKFKYELHTVLGMTLVMGLSWFPGAKADLNEGLVAYYPFNGNTQDASGNGNDGTVNGATLTEDRFGNADNAYQFNNSYISVPDSPMLKPAQLSVAAWVEPFSAAIWNTVVIKTTRSSWTDGYGIAYYNATQFGFYVDHYNQYRILTTIELNKWSHVVGTFDGSTMKLYINGELVGTSPGSAINHSTDPLQIGKGGTGNSYFWDGKIDDVRIYNRTLSEDEIKSLYDLPDPQVSTTPTTPTSSHTVELKSGQQVMDINFGNAPTGAGGTGGGIGGIKWEDLNADGERQPNEPGLPGVTIYLDLNNNGAFDTEEPHQITNENGNYKFSNLEAGTYVVRELVPDGYTQTFPN